MASSDVNTLACRGEEKANTADRPILVIDDDEREGTRVRDLLIAHSKEIECIAPAPTSVRHDLTATELIGQLKVALRAISNSDGDTFRSVTSRMPTVVILDQYLPSPEGGDTTLEQSRKVQELINAVWEKAIDQPTFRAMGWNICVLMYTSQGARQMGEGLVRQVTNKDWFDYAQKPQCLAGRSQQETIAEGARFVAQINALKSRTKIGVSAEVVFELYAGEQGHTLLSAMTIAKAAKKPVWLVARDEDGREELVMRILGFTPDGEPRTTSEEGLLEELQKMRSPGYDSGNPVFRLTGTISQVSRIRYAVSMVSQTRFVVIMDALPDAGLTGVFNIVTIKPLYEWSPSDLREVFAARFKCKIESAAIQWLRKHVLTYQQFERLYFDEGTLIMIERIEDVMVESGDDLLVGRHVEAGGAQSIGNPEQVMPGDQSTTDSSPISIERRQGILKNTRVLISLHGIRTRGAWQKEFQSSCDLVQPRLLHRPFDFGFFGAIQLLVPPLREKKVKWFLDEYTRLIKIERLEGHPPSILAHSFGTYLVGRAMEKHSEIQFDRVILCGSILHHEYDWTARVNSGQVVRVLNDYGRKDLWVRIAEWLVDGAGSSGYRGFENSANGRLVQREHQTWRHSDYFYRLNYDRHWVPFILGKCDPDSLPLERLRKTNWRFRSLVILVVVVICVYAGFSITGG